MGVEFKRGNSGKSLAVLERATDRTTVISPDIKGARVRIPLCYRFKVWAVSFSPRRPSSLSCINEYLGGLRLAIGLDGGGNVSE